MFMTMSGSVPRLSMPRALLTIAGVWRHIRRNAFAARCRMSWTCVLVARPQLGGRPAMRYRRCSRFASRPGRAGRFAHQHTARLEYADAAAVHLAAGCSSSSRSYPISRAYILNDKALEFSVGESWSRPRLVRTLSRYLAAGFEACHTTQ